jgi:dihydroorotate dehydrogenase (NAD+) catalytic subunit
MKANLSIDIAGVRFKNPVFVASGTFGTGDEMSRWLKVGNLGGIVTKTVTLKPRTGNPPPRICETASGMLNAIGLQNDGLDCFLKNTLPRVKKFKIPVIVSVAGENVEEYVWVAKSVEENGADMIELNLSCPNIDHDFLVAQNIEASYSVVKNVKSAIKIPVIAKISPQVTDVKIIAKNIEQAGGDAISLINTFPAMVIDIKQRRPKIANITGGLSGPAIKPIAVKMVYDVYNSVKIPIIGMGGILNVEDALEFFIAGASAIAVGTGNFINPQAAVQIISGLQDYLFENKIEKIRDLTGSLNSYH